jgi:type IV secretory pathway VirB10-like protein
MRNLKRSRKDAVPPGDDHEDEPPTPKRNRRNPAGAANLKPQAASTKAKAAPASRALPVVARWNKQTDRTDADEEEESRTNAESPRRDTEAAHEDEDAEAMEDDAAFEDSESQTHPPRAQLCLNLSFLLLSPTCFQTTNQQRPSLVRRRRRQRRRA